MKWLLEALFAGHRDDCVQNVITSKQILHTYQSQNDNSHTQLSRLMCKFVQELVVRYAHISGTSGTTCRKPSPHRPASPPFNVGWRHICFHRAIRTDFSYRLSILHALQSLTYATLIIFVNNNNNNNYYYCYFLSPWEWSTSGQKIIVI